MDTYMTLNLKHVKEDTYKAKLIMPIRPKFGEHLRVSLCSLSYKQNSNDFLNASTAIFEVAYHKPPPLPQPQPNPNPTPTPILTSRSTPRSTVDFIRCRLENGEYSPHSLCEAVNNEIRSKLTSHFKKNQCYFWYNEVIRRVELRIDGVVEPNSGDALLSAIIYYPLSKFLGLTLNDSTSISFPFVSSYFFIFFCK